MEHLKIPVWLISLVGVVFILVVLERLYIAQVPVKIWGLELNQPATSEVGKIAKSELTNVIACENKCNKDLGSVTDRYCFVTLVNGDFNGGGEYVKVTPEGSGWRLITNSEGRYVRGEARCIKY